ncbi:MAG TPA: hypothetical protein VGG19_11400 [Tepidisphaeraceae bacterium]|jgi:hypothetical protein
MRRTINFVSLELTASAKQQLEEISDQTGMTQNAVSCRIFEWFVAQSEAVQMAILEEVCHLSRRKIKPQVFTYLTRQIFVGLAKGRKIAILGAGPELDEELAHNGKPLDNDL